MVEELVSIIIPVYNAENYIGETINSVKNQTYHNWECICIDDCSDDRSVEIIEEYARYDNRFRIIRLIRNYGAAYARNKGIELAIGKYIAFLDSDDIWDEKKLEKQIYFMLDNEYSFTCTSYGKIDEHSNLLSKECRCDRLYEYDDLLIKCPGNSTVIYNSSVIGKVYGENIKRRNDFAMWLRVIRIEPHIHGLDEILSYHRVRNNSISRNKLLLLKYQFIVYYKQEKISLIKSVYLVIIKVLQTIIGVNG